MDSDQLRIRAGTIPGTYRFLMGGVDVTGLIKGAELTLYYTGARQGLQKDDERMTRVIVGSEIRLPDRYSVIIYEEKTNGSISTSHTRSGKDPRKA
jgi:hypothetical protein